MRSRRVRVVVGVGVLACAVAGAGIAAGSYSGSSGETLTIVGTSDVSDSNLMAAVLKPGFEAAYPNITLNYVPLGTGPAITTAETGAASALLVHAAPLEATFVQQGYSAEKYGRAVFFGDYVLLGPASDPAGVLSGSAPSHNIVHAVTRIAAAGAAGTANFVSRGGTPGTTVKEHEVWQLASRVTTCSVSAADGGGASPSATSGRCPTATPYPHWYHVTGAAQAANVEIADVCPYHHGNCYTLTDRGTFQYLQATKAISRLQIVTRDNSARAPGGATLLVNSFHAYAVNPAKFTNPNVDLNLAAAESFLNWVTSPPAQAAIGRFEAHAPNGAPFTPDASPLLAITHVRPGPRASALPVTVKGTLTNAAPGTPPLSGVPVTLDDANTPGAGPIATTTTGARGQFTLRGRPHVGASLTVSTPTLRRVEIPGPQLDPAFGDILMPRTVPVPAGRSAS